MKALNFYLGLFISFTFLLTSCSSDDDYSTYVHDDIPPATPASFRNLKQTAIQNLTQTFQFEVDGITPISFTSTQGVEVSIPTYCLTKNGQALTGDIEVEFVELYNRNNLLTTGISTMGKHPNGDLEMLVTGGAFFLNIFQDGEAIDNINCGIYVQVPTANTGGVDYDMILWNGVFDENENLVWDNEGPEGGQLNAIEMDDNIYYAFFDQFGWTNIDRFYNDPRPKTTMLVKVPEGFDNTNSSIYISYDGEDNALARLDRFDSDLGLFTEHYGQIPIGLECHIVFATEGNNNWRFAIMDVEITENEVYTFELSHLIIGTEQQLKNIIDNLP